MKVIICGGRGFSDWQFFSKEMNRFEKLNGKVTVVIHGCARGADNLADQWAREKHLEIIGLPAEWARFGRKAGPMRNHEMIQLNPDYVIAFPGGAGTANMMDYARSYKVRLWEAGR